MLSHSDPQTRTRCRRGVMQFSHRVAIAAAGLLVLAGCATPHPGGSVSSIAVGDVRAATPATPQSVRWGGTIASIANSEDGTTTLEIVSRPLSRNGRPVRNDSTDGRFFAEVNEVLDPSIVKTGRDITVTGLVGEVRDGTIGDSPYVFPVVDVNDYHYWNQQRVGYNGYNSGYYSPYSVGFHSGFIGFKHGFFGFRSHRGFGHRGFGHRGFGHRGFGHRGFRSGFRSRGFRGRGLRSSRGLRARGFSGRRGLRARR